MARFDALGIDGLQLSLEEIGDIPEDVLLRVLSAEAEALKKAQTEKVRALGLKDTGQMEQSIKADTKLRGRGSGKYLLVYPRGVRRDGKTRNAEVGYVNEYGAPQRGIAPTQWMRQANEEAADEAVRAGKEVLFAWMKSKGC